MDHEDLKAWSKRAADWGAEYHSSVRNRPVRAQVTPGEMARKFPQTPPDQAEAMDAIWEDFTTIIPEGLTHWQHPRFFAYFPSNAAPASMLADQLASTLAVNGILWQTSPVLAELETVMIDWLRQALGLPQGFRGIIQDSASSSTLTAILTMRERALGWRGIETGLAGEQAPRIYASAQTHSSIDKAVWVAGIGQANLVKIPTNADYQMDVEALCRAIARDREAGHLPAGVIGCIGGTSIGASDNLAEVLEVARAEKLYSHVDAAWAGSAMICPEFRDIWAGIEAADSIVFNPHKWLGANFDCSVQFLADPKQQLRTLGLRPDYLETLEEDDVTNLSELTIPLGRRFRALKLWFLIRAYGLDGLRRRIRNHVAWTEHAATELARVPGIEITTKPRLALFTFALQTEAQTRALLERINADGRIYLTQTIHDGRFVIRFTVGQWDTTKADVDTGIDVIRELMDP